MKMQKSLERLIEEQIKLQAYVVEILDDAAYAERFISAPNNKRSPSMYKILDYCYDKKDMGYYEKPKLVLRATPRQMTRYGLALDILLEIDNKVSDNPREARKILWLRANRFQWTKLGKMFGYHRTTVKRMYETILDKLCNKLKNNLYIYDKIFN